jgi:pyruvate dehydrogenase E1 component
VDTAASLARLGRPDGTSAYLRLSTRPVDQTLAAVPADPAARSRRWEQAVAGAYLLRHAPDPPAVTIAAMGALLPEALAAGRLAGLSMSADVVCVTSLGLLFDALQARAGKGTGEMDLDAAFPAHWAAPLVTVLDRHPHTLAFLAGIHRVPPATRASRGPGSPVTWIRYTAITAATPTAWSGAPSACAEWTIDVITYIC